MIRVILIVLLLLAESHANADDVPYKVKAKNGDVVIKVQGAKKSLAKNGWFPLRAGVTVTWIGGKGEAEISRENKVKKTLNEDNKSYKVPSKGFFEEMKLFAKSSSRKLGRSFHDFNSPDISARAGVTRGLVAPKVVTIDINASRDDAYFSFYSKALFPLPAVLTIYDANGSKCISYTFESSDMVDTKEPEVFFTIPTDLLESGQTFNVICGKQYPKEKMRGNIRILP